MPEICPEMVAAVPVLPMELLAPMRMTGPATVPSIRKLP